ncbi:MAG TPA: glycosyltransferase family 39 protein, partial [Phycisphaerales bacterium]|nr:glycosyltransferase family 39 protein [Phycisphaerales bacterium]
MNQSSTSITSGSGVIDGKDSPRGGAEGRWLGRIVLLILIITLARVLYLVILCPYELIEDEAHYWEWSRRLGLSYYTKGPGVAWSIAASTMLFGTSEAAIRLPSVLTAAISSLAIGGLARDVFKSGRAGFYAAALFQLAPVFQFAGLVMTIDSPYVACWAVACLAAWRSLNAPPGERRLAWWLLLGGALGVGFLYKYTILLLLPGILIGWWLARRTRGDLSLTRIAPMGLLGALATFCICASPVAIWNAMNGWPTIRHLLGHLGVAGGDVKPAPSTGGFAYNPGWTLELIAVQCVMMGALCAPIAGSLYWLRRGDVPTEIRRGGRFLIGCALPIFIFYIAVTFAARAEGNWPIAGFVTLIVLAGGWIDRGIGGQIQTSFHDGRGSMERGRRTFAEDSWRICVVSGIIVGVLMLRVDLLARLPLIGPLVPVGRLIGGKEQALHVDELRASLKARTGLEPLILVQHYGQAGRIAYYLHDRPVVLCTSSAMGGRTTQYDYWPDTTLNQESLAGRPGILLGGELAQWQHFFDEVEGIGQIRGETKKNRQSFLGLGYRPAGD